MPSRSLRRAGGKEAALIAHRLRSLPRTRDAIGAQKASVRNSEHSSAGLHVHRLLPEKAAPVAMHHNTEVPPISHLPILRFNRLFSEVGQRREFNGSTGR
jgi:hypothetical protein